MSLWLNSVWVNMLVYVHTYMCLYAHKHIYVSLGMCMYVCVNRHCVCGGGVCICLCPCVCAGVYVYVWAHENIYVCVHVCSGVWDIGYACVSVCMVIYAPGHWCLKRQDPHIYFFIFLLSISITEHSALLSGHCWIKSLVDWANMWNDPVITLPSLSGQLYSNDYVIFDYTNTPCSAIPNHLLMGRKHIYHFSPLSCCYEYP